MDETLKSKRKITVYDLVVVGLMAAVCYVATNFRIEFPTPVGKMMVHMGNIFCLLSGLLFGGMRGGLSAGIGSCIFDLLTGWATSAPSTLINKFVMGFLAGWIPRLKGKEGKSIPFNILGAVCGMYGYTILYLSYSFIKDIVLGSAVETAWADIIFKAPISLANGTLGIIISVVLAALLRPALEKAGLYQKFIR